MSYLQRVAAIERERKRLLELACSSDSLWYLCYDVLGYGWTPSKQQGMTEEFHDVLCKRMDNLREHPRVLNLWPRKHLKTTIITIGLTIQELLRDPDCTVLICHAVEDEVNKIIAEIVDQFKNNAKLRALRPDIMPNPKSTKWYRTDQLTIRRKKFSRQPSVLGKSAGSEITGAHVDLIFLDDIIGRKTIEDSGLPKVASWYQNTILPVLNPNGRIRAVATPWHIDDITQTWMKDKHWDCVIRACLETDGKPDYKGQPVLYGPGEGKIKGGIPAALERIELARDEMKNDFPPQMMCDPSPSGEKPWDRAKCEHYIPLSEAKGPGALIVLSDPAPAKVGSLDFRGAKQRGDGSKDDWATAVFKVRRRGLRREAILLDGKYSKDWDVNAGFDVVCDLKRKWHAERHAVEATGQAIALYEDTHRKAARRGGVGFRPVTLEGTYRGNAKNTYFGALASLAENDEFLICAESCDKDFLDKFLAQAREWRPMPDGGNSLKYDDCANVVSFVTDPAVLRLAPVVSEEFTWSPFRAEEKDEPLNGTRYVRW